MNCNKCKALRSKQAAQENEKDGVRHAVETESIFAESIRETRRTNRFLWATVAVLLALCVALIGVIAYKDATMQSTISAAIADSQESINAAMIEALNSVAEMEATSEITTTTTMEGDGITYNDVAGNQFNDSAQQNGGAE